MDLNRSKMLITGASSGIGAATATAAAQAGAQVILLARTAAKLEQVAAEIRRTGGRAHVYPVDVTDAAAVNQCAQQIAREVGLPDILVNNAGAGRWLSIEETRPAEAAVMMSAPYLAAFYITRAFLPAMLQRNRGTIVNMTSIASQIA